jgi:HAE1 family hydrophobic/amphiphilic exporter-1
MHNIVIQRAKFLIYLFVILSLIGAASLFNLPVSIYPQIEKPSVRVVQTFEQDSWSFYLNLGQQMESSYKSIEGVEEVEAIYSRGEVTFFVHFGWDANSKEAKRDVETIASFYQAQLPKHIPKARISFFDPSSENYIAFKTTELNAEELGVLIRNSLLPKLETIPGVAEAWTSEQSDKQIRISLKPYRMLQYGVNVQDVVTALHFNEFDLDLGSLRDIQEGDIGTSLKQRYSSTSEIAELNIKSITGKSVKISDIADVELYIEERKRFFFLDEDEVIAVAVWQEPGTNIYDISKQFQHITSEFAHGKAELLTINDPNVFIEEAILNILFAILLGMLSASIVVLLFYRKLSSIIFICTIMPVCLLLAFLIMNWVGVGINLLSLGAMSIAIGMVVDNAILVMDSLTYHQKRFGQLNHVQVVKEMIAEVRTPFLTSNLTTIVVFIPLIYTEPMTASLLTDLALVTVSILSVSAFVSLLFIPAMFVMINPTPATSDQNSTQSAFLEHSLLWIDKTAGLKYLLPALTLVLCIVLCIELLPKIKKEIIAQPKAQIVDVSIKFNGSGLSRERKLEIIQPLRNALQKHVGEHLKHQYVDVRKNEAYISLHLKDYRNFEQVLEKLGTFDTSPFDAEITYEPWITGALNIKNPADLELRFNLQSESDNRRLMEEASAIAKSSGLVNRVKLTPSSRKVTEHQVDLNARVLADLSRGRSFQSEIEQLGNFVRYSVEPQKITDLRSNDGIIPVLLSIGDPLNSGNYMKNPYDLSGHNLMLQNLLKVSTTEQWREFYSNNSRPTFSVELWFQPDADFASINNLVDGMRNNLGINSFTVLYPDAETTTALHSIIISVCLSVVIVFLVVMFHFKTLSNTCSVMTAVVFAVTGGLFSIYVMDSTISLNSMLGLLILVGLSVNNTILLQDFYQSQMMTAHSKYVAIANSIRRRIRSLLVTNLTTIVGMLPIAIGFGAGQDILKPLGICVVGGLIIATLLSLLIFPVILLLLPNNNQAGYNVDSTEHASSFQP